MQRRPPSLDRKPAALSVRALLIGVFGLLGLLQLAGSALLFAKAWQGREQSIAIRGVEHFADRLFVAFPPLGFERGSTIQLLKRPLPAAPEDLARIAAQRQRSDRALAQARLAAEALRPGLAARLDEHIEALAALRRAADADMIRPAPARDPQLAAILILEFVAVLDGIADLVRGLGSEVAGEDARFHVLNDARLSTMRLRNSMGMEAGSMVAFISAGTVPDAQAMQEIMRTRERARTDWLMLSERVHRIDSARLDRALAAVRGNVVNILQRHFGGILASWAHGDPAPMTDREYDRVVRPALGSLTPLMEELSRQTQVHAAEVRRQADRGIALSAGLLLGSLGLAALALTLTSRLVISPIEGLAATARGVAAGDEALRAAERGVNEVRALALQLNRMLDARAEATRQLRASEARWQYALEGAGAGVWDWQLARDRLYLSPQWKALIGYQDHELANELEAWRSRVHPEDLPLTMAGITACIEGRDGHYDIEHRMRCKDGGYRWLRARGKVVERAADGRPLRLIGTHEDVTARRRTEQSLKVLNATLEARVAQEVAMNREKDHLLIQQSRLAAMGEMIGNIAHQWRQPINALGLVLANLEDAHDHGDLTDAYLGEQVVRAGQLIQRMSHTIDDFRDFFKPNRLRQDFRLAEVVQETAAIVEPSYAHNGIELVVELREDVRVHGFRSEYGQVLLNLLANAKDAVLEGRVARGRVQVVVETRGAEALLCVSDNGGGIPPEVLPKIFDPYFTTREQGSGIGLYMSKMIMANMQGRIEARNGAEGAELCLSCPRVQAPS